MATIKIEVVNGATTYTQTKTVSAAHLGRLLDALKAVYGQISIGPLPTDVRDRTNAEVADEWMRDAATGLNLLSSAITSA